MEPLIEFWLNNKIKRKKKKLHPYEDGTSLNSDIFSDDPMGPGKNTHINLDRDAHRDNKGDNFK